MCVAIFKPKGQSIKKRALRKCYDGNPHGCGLAFPHKGEVEILKGMWSFERFWHEYQEHQHRTLLVHFRWATSGEKDTENCHPWPLNDGKMALVHNGVIGIHQTLKTLSDTGNFVRLVFEPMIKSGVAMDSSAFKFLVEECVGTYNKIVTLDHKARVAIFNEKHGEWHKGVWFSNDGYKSQKFRSTGYLHGEWPAKTTVTAEGELGGHVWETDSLPWRERQEFIENVCDAITELEMTRDEAIDWVRMDFNLSRLAADKIVKEEGQCIDELKA